MEQHKSIALVVDDEPDFRDILREEFAEAGFEALEASGGRAAFELLERSKVDVLVTDYRMPDGDGLFLLRKIQESGIRIPVILFVSGYLGFDPEEVRRLGVAQVLSKPLRASDLIEQARARLASGPF